MTLPPSIGPYRPYGTFADDGITTSYRVRGPAGTSVILKTFPLEAFADPESRDRFRREVQIAMRVHHPNVWEVEDWGFWGDGTPYFVMADQGDRLLSDELGERGPFRSPAGGG